MNLMTVYNKDEVLRQMKNLKISKTSSNEIITEHFGRVISRSQRTDRYGVFQFGNFVTKILPQVESYFTPRKMKLSVTGGFQEIKLFGETFIINGEIFHHMLTIISSSDGSRALAMNVGLLRQVCTNGMMVAVKGDRASVHTKHFNSSVPEKVKLFAKQLPHLTEMFAEQENIIREIGAQPMSLKQFATALVPRDEKTKKLATSLMTNLRGLTNKLLYSSTDRLDISKVDHTKRTILYSPGILMDETNTLDIEVPKWKLFNCYTEMFRDKDSNTIKRESTRVYHILAGTK